MFVAGIDAHTTFVMIAIVDQSGNSVHGPARIPNVEADRLVRLLEKHTPVEVVVETCPSWPWLFDLLERPGIHLVLAHAKRLTAIADSTYKRDEVDAELLARMRLAGLIPEDRLLRTAHRLPGRSGQRAVQGLPSMPGCQSKRARSSRRFERRRCPGRRRRNCGPRDRASGGCRGPSRNAHRRGGVGGG